MGWMIASLGAILLSLVFCNLCTNHPRTGGPHVYVEDAFGKTPGFFIAWVYWILAWIGYAALVVAIMGCITTITGPLPKLMVLGLEIAIILLFTAINLRQVAFAGKVELILTVVKVMPLIILPILALPSINTDLIWANPPNNQETCLGALAIVVLRMIFAFMGFETGTVPCEEIENPRVNIPKATVLGTLIAAGIYMLGTIAIFGHVPYEVLQDSKAPYADLAASVFGGNWQTFIALTGALCALGALNGWMLIGGRIAYGAAQDGIFPKIFKKTDKSGAPTNAIIISSLCTIPFLMLSLSDNLVNQFNFVVDISVSLVIIVYLACMLAYLKFLKESKKAPAHQWILGIVSATFCGWILSSISLEMTMYSLLAFVLGLPMYLKMRQTTH
jgi:APA family basic amino acid/polyamine antiporter